MMKWIFAIFLLTTGIAMADERKYSVSEIDRMRHAVKIILIKPMIPYYQSEMDARIEAELRTYMLNGTTPEELENAASESAFFKVR